MENFNKNWLLILLIAVVFGTLGFLLGRTTGDRDEHRVMRFHEKGGNEFIFEGEGDHELHEDGDVKVTVKIDTVMKDGKQVIIKEEKRVK